MAVLDTNFLIAVRAGDPEAVRLLKKLSVGPMFVPAIVAAEFLTKERTEEVRSAALAVLEEEFDLGHTDHAWVLEAARLRLELRARGQTLRLPDHWIAAWSRLTQTPVVTRNVREFRRFGVETLTW